MPTRYIAIAPESGVNPSDLARVSAALQKQVTRDLGPVWHVSATVDPFPSLEDVPAGYWPIILTFRALGTDGGIHIDSNGQPYALIEMSPSWSLTASHVAMEMITDPFGSRSIPGASPREGQGDVEFRGGVCDPCEHPDSAYLVNDVLVSDFCTPAFWEPSSKGRRSFTGAIQEPYQIMPGGHLCWYDPATNTWWLRRSSDGVLTDIEVGMIDPEHGTVREFLCRHSLHLQSTKLSLEAFEARVGITRQRAMRASQSRAYWLRASLQRARSARPLEFEAQVRAELSAAPGGRDPSPRPPSATAHEPRQSSRPAASPKPAQRVSGDFGVDDRSDGEYDAVTIDSVDALGGRPPAKGEVDRASESDVTTIYEVATAGDLHGGAARDPVKRAEPSSDGLPAPDRAPAIERSSRTPPPPFPEPVRTAVAEPFRAVVAEPMRVTAETVRGAVTAVAEPVGAVTSGPSGPLRATPEPVRATTSEPVRVPTTTTEPVRATVPGPEPLLERSMAESLAVGPVESIPQSQPGSASANGRMRTMPPPLPGPLPPLSPLPARGSLRSEPPRDEYARSSATTIRPAAASIPPRKSGTGWIPMGWGVLMGLLVASVAGVSAYVLRRDASSAAAGSGGVPAATAEITPAAPAFAAASPAVAAPAQSVGVQVLTAAPAVVPPSSVERATRPSVAGPGMGAAPVRAVSPVEAARVTAKATTAPAQPPSPPASLAAARPALARVAAGQSASVTAAAPAHGPSGGQISPAPPDMESIVDEFGGRN